MTRKSARQWLLDKLASGDPHLSTNLLDEGVAAGYNRSTLLAARQRLPLTVAYAAPDDAPGLRPGVPRAVVWALDTTKVAPPLEKRVADLEARLAALEERTQWLGSE